MSCQYFLPEARWIWPKISMYLLNCYAGFRYDFNQENLPLSAPFLITADQSYKLHVNGHYVCRGPMRGQQEEWYYDIIDILPYLKTGHNFIAIECHNPGCSTFYYHHKDAAGLLCSAAWDNGVKIYSNAKDWQIFRNTAYNHNTAQLSGQMGKMEEIDLFYDDRSWITKIDNYTLPPPMVGVTPMEKVQGCLPWTSLKKRPIEMLKEELIIPKEIFSFGSGAIYQEPPQAPGIIPNIAYNFLTYEKDSITFSKEPLGSFVNNNGISFEVPPAESNKFNVITLDLGQYTWLPGTPILEFGNNTKGVIVDLFYNQYVPDSKLPFHLYPASGSNVALASRIYLGGKPVKVELFQTIGARFVTIVVRENLESLPITFAWRSAVYPLRKIGNFSSSNETINEIYNIAIHSQEVCAMDAFVDTPWREQSQWWGDARVQARNMIFLANDTKLFKSGIYNIVAQKNPVNLPFANAPTKCCGPILPDFALTWIVTLFDYYYQTKDLTPFEELKDIADNIFNYFEEHLSSNGLLKFDPRFWLFEDWSPLPKSNIPTFINLWYIYCQEKYLMLLKAANYTVKASQLAEKIAHQKELVSNLLFCQKEQLFLPEIGIDGQLCGTPSVHDQVLAILLDLQPQATQNMLEKVILPCLNGSLKEGAQPSAFWATYLLDCAYKCGKYQEALQYIQRMWEPMIPSGTTFENFNVKSTGELSLSHAWSAHVISHIPELVFGLEQLSAKWEKIRIMPNFILDEAKFTIPLPQGILSINLRGTKDNYSGSIEIPKNVDAEIILPNKTISASGEVINL